MHRPLMLFAFVVACLAATPGARAASPEDSTLAAPRESPAQRLANRTSVVGSEGRARALPGSAHFLGLDVLPYQNQSFDDVHRLMLRIPGVYAIGEDGYGLRPDLGMRGVDPYRSAGMTMLEDGVPASPAPYAAPGMPVFAGLGRMESVETLKGPAGIAYGPRTSGGVVNMMTLSAPDDLVAQARLSLGSYDAHTLHADYGDSWKSASWMLGTHQARTDGFKALDGGGETGFEHDDYVAKLRFRSTAGTGPYQDVLLKVGWFETDAHDSFLGLTDADFHATPYRRYAASRQDRMKHDALQLLLRHFIAVDDAVDVTTTLYRNETELDWYLLDSVNGESPADVLASPSAFADEYALLAGDSTSADDALTVKSNARSYFSHGIQSALGMVFATGEARHDLETGLRYHEDEEDRLHRNDGWRMVSGGAMILTSRGADGGAGGGDNQINEAQSLAGFLRDRISGGKWSLTPGLRVEYVSTKQSSYAAGDADRSSTPAVEENSTTAVLPGLGATYQATGSVLLLGGVHAGFTPPPAGTGGDGLDAIHYEAGARARHRNADAALVGFRTAHGLAKSSSRLQTAWGIEASAGYSIQDPAYGVDLSAVYTFTHAEYDITPAQPDDAGNYITKGDAVPYVPEHVASASLALTTKKSWAGVTATAVSRMRTRPGSGDIPAWAVADEYFLLDIVTEYELIRHARVFASVYNVTDDVYVASRFPYGAHPGAPRTFAAGLKLGL